MAKLRTQSIMKTKSKQTIRLSRLRYVLKKFLTPKGFEIEGLEIYLN
jgi:hypothetical protein